MSRHFVKINIEEFKDKIQYLRKSNNHISSLTSKIKKDFKVKVDFENFSDSSDSLAYSLNGLMGYNVLPNGLTFLGMIAGGDWEFPVFFIFYWDGKDIRAYIPTEGNPWNTSTKQAYGNDEEKDAKNAKKRYGYDDDYDFSVETLSFVKEDIIKDIVERIKEK